MQAAYAEALGLPDPLDGLVVGDRPPPSAPDGWEIVAVRAATLNHHDLWTLQGVVGVRFDPPVTLGCDGAGVTADGREVVFYPVLGWGDDFRMLTDGIDGTFATHVALPSSNLLPKPEHLSFAEAAGLGTAWLTAWRMLFTKGGLREGQRVLVQGATGGVASAAIALASAAGAHVTATSRSDAGLEHALRVGADESVPSGTRLADRVDVVIETVGAATWSHSLRSLAYGGRVVVSGATSGSDAPADLQRVFWRELQVLGSMMGTPEEMRDLCDFVSRLGLRPEVSKAYDGIASVPEAMRDLAAGHQLGKLAILVD
ncbi:MAG: zinc-binding dehydrogenase [Acidimicrobiia bacterium]|nr:zinc-binding dehydrogenase [Acidimicrobiia bacterium]